MNGNFGSYRAVWIEKTKTEHQHGGQGWEFGQSLWVPVASESGRRINELMRCPLPDDLVIHSLKDTWPGGIIEARFCDTSLVAGPCIETNEEPPVPGEWAGRGTYFRIPLKNYEQLTNPIAVQHIRNYYYGPIETEILQNQPRHFYFNRYRPGVIYARQGGYLSKCTEVLFNVLRDALLGQAASLAAEETLPHAVYREGYAIFRELKLLARSSGAVRQAKQLHGLDCIVCGFNFEQTYGELGEGYIECHHLEQLADAGLAEPAGIETVVDNLAVVCANCHRMLHRRRPPFSIDELRTFLI